MSGIVPTFPTVKYPFPTPLKPVHVPAGCYPIEVVQFWRGEVRQGYPYPLHWTIIIRTSPERGNTHEIVGDLNTFITHEIVGDLNTFITQDRFDVPLHMSDRDDWRGSLVVGFVSPGRLNQLMNRIALTEVLHGRQSWNCQNWVHEALYWLNYPGLYTDVNMTLAALQAHMCCLLEAWELGNI